MICSNAVVTVEFDQTVYSVSEDGDGQVTLLASVLGQSDITIQVDLITTVGSATCELLMKCVGYYIHHNHHIVAFFLSSN